MGLIACFKNVMNVYFDKRANLFQLHKPWFDFFPLLYKMDFFFLNSEVVN